MPKGFTLIELLIVISIIGVVFGVVISASAGVQRRGRDAQRQSDLRNLQSALQQYYADQIFYPEDDVPAANKFDLPNLTSFTDCTGNVVTSPCNTPSKTYLSKVPRDPVPGTNTPYCYKVNSAVIDSSTIPPVSCDNSVLSTTKCQSYLLCASLENSGSSSQKCQNLCGSKYNFEVTPN